MKSILPWFCLIAAANAFANEGIEAYREGHYSQAAEELARTKNDDPVVSYYLGRMRLYGYGQLKNNTLAIRHFQQAGEKGFAPAQQIMARYALIELKNPEEALYWFKKLAASEDQTAQMYCAAAYLFGVGTKKNSDTAQRYYIAAAKGGNAIAQYQLADSFLDTHHAANKKLGLIWLNKAVEQKNPKAQTLLSELYLKGNGVEHDLTKAKEYADLAIKQGYVPALYQMGDIYFVENNYLTAKEWYLKASDANYVPAQIALSELYANKNTPFYDLHNSFLWMLKAAQSGANSEAQFALATMYKNGEGIDADTNLAEEWQLKAKETAKREDANVELKMVQWLTNDKITTFAQTPYRLEGILTTWQNPGVLKENNYNPAPQMDNFARESLYQPKFVMVDPNSIPVNEYYNALVATLKDTTANTIDFPHYLIIQDAAASNPTKDGFDYLHSIPANTDMQQMFRKLEGQAILGDSTAQFDVAQMYQQGLGVQKNMHEAIKYYRLATLQQDLRAEYNLGLIYLNGDEGVEPDYKLALDFLTDAAFKGNVRAQYALGRLNDLGFKDAKGNEIVKPNHETAVSMYNLSAASDFGPAQYRLAEILVREKPTDVSQMAKAQRAQLIKQLYAGAVTGGVKEAILPLAFYNAMDSDKAKQSAAFASAQKAAETGNPQAALLLGLMYDRGIAVSPDHQEALNWYQKAKENPIGAFILGTYISEGNGIGQDKAQGQDLIQKAANENFAYANLNLAIMKRENKEDFLSELTKAHDLGNSTASLLLADYYLSLASSADQMQQARNIYQTLAEKGDQDGQLKLAYLLEKGLGGSIDLANAQKWYTQSAEQGQPIAQYLLGRFYQLGLLEKLPNYAFAKQWYAAAQAKYAPAAVALGFIYDTVDDDYQHALLSYQKAADQGDINAQYDLGLIYEKGKGYAVDLTKAQELYAQAAARGHSQAMVQLAGLYLNGINGSRDEKQALEWYQKAATAGNRDALYQMGLLSETGVAKKLDYTDAVRYYKEAADKGNAKAMLALARMYQYGLGVPKDMQQATQLYQTLSSMDNPYAQYQLAMFYVDGVGGESQAQQGKRLLLQAEKNGSPQARKALQWLDSQTQQRTSFIEPVEFAPKFTNNESVSMLYMQALSAWNGGDVALSKTILAQIVNQYPDYAPAKEAYQQLMQERQKEGQVAVR